MPLNALLCNRCYPLSFVVRMHAPRRAGKIQLPAQCHTVQSSLCAARRTGGRKVVAASGLTALWRSSSGQPCLGNRPSNRACKPTWLRGVPVDRCNHTEPSLLPQAQWQPSRRNSSPIRHSNFRWKHCLLHQCSGLGAKSGRIAASPGRSSLTRTVHWFWLFRALWASHTGLSRCNAPHGPCILFRREVLRHHDSAPPR